MDVFISTRRLSVKGVGVYRCRAGRWSRSMYKQGLICECNPT